MFGRLSRQGHLEEAREVHVYLHKRDMLEAVSPSTWDKFLEQKAYDTSTSL
jgi:hypothetical protein